MDPELSSDQPEPAPGVPRGAVWACWKSYPGGYPAWFALLKGDIEVKGIDEALYKKLCSVANALGARIFREDGEEIKSVADL